jgi:hypothetical protein
MSLNPPNTPISPSNLDAIRSLPLPPPAAFATARQESEWFQSDKKRREHRREQQAKAIIHIIIQMNLVGAGIAIMFCIFVRVAHLIIPEDFQWLSVAQIELLDDLAKYAGSGAIGSLLTRYLQKNVGNEESPAP